MAFTDRYVAEDASGLDDGTSASAPWTWSQMLDNAVAGHRVHIKGGTYSRGANSDSFVSAGTGTSPIYLNGYNATPGDLDPVERTNGVGLWDTTGWPQISYTSGRLTLPANCVICQLNYESGRGGDILIGLGVAMRCKIANSAGGDFAYGCSLGGGAVNCDISSNGRAAIKLVNFSAYNLNYMTAPNGAAMLDTGSLGRASNFGRNVAYNCVTGIEASDADQYGTIDGWAFYGISGSAIKISSGKHIIVTNCVAYGVGTFYERTVAGPLIAWHNAVGDVVTLWDGIGDYETLTRNHVTLTASPYQAGSSQDFRLNDTEGGGAACKAAGIWSAADIGPVQSAASGGGSTFTGIIPSNGRRLGL